MRIVVGDGCERVVQAVLQLDVHSYSELLDVERRARPADPDLFPTLAGTARPPKTARRS
jgi:hypothetical protein